MVHVRLMMRMTRRWMRWCFGRNRATLEIFIVVKIIIVVNSHPSHFSNDCGLPCRDWLTIIHAIHPDGKLALVAISTRYQRCLESKMIASGNGKCLLNLTQSGSRTLVTRFRCQEDIGLRLSVSILRYKVPYGRHGYKSCVVMGMERYG